MSLKTFKILDMIRNILIPCVLFLIIITLFHVFSKEILFVANIFLLVFSIILLILTVVLSIVKIKN